MSLSCPPSLLVLGWTVPRIHDHRGSLSGPKNKPKYAQNKRIHLSPCTKRTVRGAPSLKYPREYLCHVCLLCQCPCGPYITFVTIGAPLRPPKKEFKYAQTNQIRLCPCSNSLLLCRLICLSDHHSICHSCYLSSQQSVSQSFSPSHCLTVCLSVCLSV